MAGLSFEIYQVPEGQRRAGMWSFRAGGQESLFYSSTQEGAERKVRALLNGQAAGTVQLRVVRSTGAGGLVGAAAAQPAPAVDYMAAPTAGERVAAFMRRGKLGQPQS